MATLYTQQTKNVEKTWMLMSVFLIIVIAIGYVFSRMYNNPTILYFFVIFSVVMNIVSYWYSDKIALAASGARPFKREENEELWDIVENLSIASGLPMPKLYIINDASPNAFATGRNKEHAAVAVTTGLLHLLDKNELEGVIAHELAHIGNKDILLQTVVVVLVGFIALLSDIFLRSMFWGGGDRDSKAGVWLMLIGIVLAILSPFIATLIQLAVSRKREFLADSTGALMTRYPEGLASALEKISGNGTPLKRANNATAHLFISNPFGKKGRKGLHKLFMTHPPTEERVKALRA
jgi:heat shock protein HtpX